MFFALTLPQHAFFRIVKLVRHDVQLRLSSEKIPDLAPFFNAPKKQALIMLLFDTLFLKQKVPKPDSVKTPCFAGLPASV